MNSFSYSLNQLARFCNAQFKGVSEDVMIHQFLIDSRKARSVHQQLFIAINGLRNDGHLFIDELYTKGFTNFLISDKPSCDIFISLFLFFCSNFFIIDDNFFKFIYVPL